MTRILGISGRRESGKDTLAAGLRKLLPGFVLIESSSDWPRDLLHEIGVPRDLLYKYKDRIIPGTDIDSREALRRLINVLRGIDPHCLMNRVIKRARDCKADWLIMPCIRNVEDVDVIRIAGGKVVRLTRIVYPWDSYSEETELDNYAQFDAVIVNDTNPPCETLRVAVNWLKGIGWM